MLRRAGLYSPSGTARLNSLSASALRVLVFSSAPLRYPPDPHVITRGHTAVRKDFSVITVRNVGSKKEGWLCGRKSPDLEGLVVMIREKRGGGFSSGIRFAIMRVRSMIVQIARGLGETHGSWS